MTEKRFVYYEHKGADYILENPNIHLDFIEMLGDCLEPQEIVERLNELYEENEQLKMENNNIHNINKEYREENLMVKEECIRLRKENEQLKQTNQRLNDELQVCMGKLALKR